VLTVDDAAAADRRVVKEGQSSAHAKLKDCPRGFQFGVTSTVIQVARLHDSLIACSVGRQQVLPGMKATPPIPADPFASPRRWHKEVVSTFWTHLDDDQLVAIQQHAVAAAMGHAAQQDWRKTHAHGAQRAAVKRKLQLQALFRSVQPVYVSEFASALRQIAGGLRAVGDDRVTWRSFQSCWPSIASRYQQDLLPLFRQGAAARPDLAKIPTVSAKYSLSFTTWSGAQTVLIGTQIVFQVCSMLLSASDENGDPAMTIPGKTRNARKRATYLGTLIKRFKLVREDLDGYPGPIFVGQ